MANEDIKKEGTEERKIMCWPSPGCIHMCGLIASVKDGRLVGLNGNKDYITPNRGCADRIPPLKNGCTAQANCFIP
jgi:hypothetical protein